MTWLDERRRTGGIDEVPLPAGVPGRLWLCGKHLIGPDVAALVDRVRADVVVCLNERHELAGRYDDYVRWLDGGSAEADVVASAPAEARRTAEADEPASDLLGGTSRSVDRVWHPIPDLHAPPAEAIAPLLADLTERLRAGDRVVVHCGAGKGRAGTVAAALLLGLGVPLEEGLATVAAARTGAGPEAGAQLELLRDLSRAGGG